MSLIFLHFGLFFSLDEAEKRVGGKERGAGSRSLTKDHFNRNYWVIAVPWAKNNISSMSAIRIRSVRPHSPWSPPHRPQHGRLLMLMSPAATDAHESPPAQLKGVFNFLLQGQEARKKCKAMRETREETHTRTYQHRRFCNHPNHPETHFKWISICKAPGIVLGPQ